MPLTVQTDSSTVVANADSYISVTDADTYFSNRNVSAWTGANAVKEGALRYATRWVDQRYRWVGVISDNTQNRLRWPRSNNPMIVYGRGPIVGVLDLNDGREWSGVPFYIREAVCEVALAHLTTGVNSTYKRGDRISEAEVGELRVKYESGAPGGITYPFVDQLIWGSGLAHRSARVVRS